MPYGYIAPKMLMTYKGVDIYHCYQDGEADKMMDYWFTTSKQEDSRFNFDIRDLPGGDQLTSMSAYDRASNWPKLLRAAIDAGVLKIPSK
jgi:hypothetical protein